MKKEPLLRNRKQPIDLPLLMEATLQEMKAEADKDSKVREGLIEYFDRSIILYQKERFYYSTNSRKNAITFLKSCRNFILGKAVFSVLQNLIGQGFSNYFSNHSKASDAFILSMIIGAPIYGTVANITELEKLKDKPSIKHLNTALVEIRKFALGMDFTMRATAHVIMLESYFKFGSFYTPLTETNNSLAALFASPAAINAFGAIAPSVFKKAANTNFALRHPYFKKFLSIFGNGTGMFYKIFIYSIILGVLLSLNETPPKGEGPEVRAYAASLLVRMTLQVGLATTLVLCEYFNLSEDSTASVIAEVMESLSTLILTYNTFSENLMAYFTGQIKLTSLLGYTAGFFGAMGVVNTALTIINSYLRDLPKQQPAEKELEEAKGEKQPLIANRDNEDALTKETIQNYRAMLEELMSKPELVAKIANKEINVESTEISEEKPNNNATSSERKEKEEIFENFESTVVSTNNNNASL